MARVIIGMTRSIDGFVADQSADQLGSTLIAMRSGTPPTWVLQSQQRPVRDAYLYSWIRAA